MTVFKGFMILVKRNVSMLFLYMAIFVSMCVMMQILTRGEGVNQFREESLDIAVIDRDGGKLAEGLREYLGTRHHIVDVEDEKSVIQERLFYRDIYYVVTIPEEFESLCLEQKEKLSTTKIPGAASAFYIDQQIDAFLNDVRILKSAGFSLEEALEETARIGDTEGKITLIDKNGYGGETPPHTNLFQYFPYLFLSVLCYILCFVMIAYREKDVRRRILCSSVSLHSQNLQLAAGFLVLGTVFWGLCMLIPVALNGREFLSDPQLLCYLLNSFVLMLTALSISFLAGMLVENAFAVNGVVNVVSLGMSFLCGVFVPADVLGEKLRLAARFLPVYWYEEVNAMIGSNAGFTGSQLRMFWQGIGIQLLFAAAILSLGLAAGRYKKTE